MRTKFVGDTATVRSVEDCLLATKRCSKKRLLTPVQRVIQGKEFPSSLETNRYEYYPHIEPGLDMSIIDAVLWLADFEPHINIDFTYDQRNDTARVVVYGGDKVIAALLDGVLGLEEALSHVARDNVVTGVTASGSGAEQEELNNG